MRVSRLLGCAVACALSISVLSASPAAAAAPGAPQLIGPTDGGIVSSVDVPLSVRASDPDGGALQVRFEGRRVGATVPGPGTADPFTVVALPDLQNYTYNNRQGTIRQQAEWVVGTRSELNTAMVVQLGDLVSEEENPTQWGHTSTGLKVLDDARVPNTVVAGNHDFNTATGAFAEYDQYFPTSRYAGVSWTPTSARYGGYMGQNLFGPDPVDRKNMNNFALFSAGGRDFLVLNLEWEAPQYALDWSAKVLAAYPDRLAIVTTHSFVGLNGLRRTTPERTGGTSADKMWTDFVYQQCSVRLVLSGHFHNGDAGEASRSDLNRCGQPVQQILTDYQDRPNGGDGWLRYYTFDPAANTMTARTYSPKLGTFENDVDSAFTVPFALTGAQPAPFATIDQDAVTSGSVAEGTWTGLEPDTLYEWRAISSDGETSTVSPIWTLRTPTSAEVVDDTFSRNVTNGWGATAAGQAWQSSSTATAYGVDGSVGRIVAPVGSTRGVRLPTVSAADVLIQTDLALSPVASGSGTYVSVLGRLAGTSSYRAKIRYLAGGAVNLSLIRFTGAEVSLASANVAGLTLTSGQYLRLKLEMEGSSPTSLRAKLWPRDATEPTAWTVAATDSTAALQSAGSLGLDVYPSSSAATPATATFDRYTVTRLGTTPPPANQAPTATIATPTIDERAIAVNGSSSTDPDGTITTYRWDFGDNQTATGPTSTHTYAADGTYTVRLTVTDDDGATGTTTRQVTVAATPPPANQAPTATIATPTIDERAIAVNGSSSTDPDGTITTYRWDFGDNQTATGPTSTHTYAADGTYTVRLTVTDDDGATGTTTRQVTVAATPPPAAEIAADTFGRTVGNGWGSAPTGGAWSVLGSASRYAVSGGTGQHLLTAPGTTTETMLSTVSARDVDLRTTLAWSRTASAGALYGTVVVRRQANGSDYRLKVVTATSGSMQLVIARKVGTTETALRSVSLPGTLAANEQFRVAFRATTTGTTTDLAAKLWRVGSPEPTGWTAVTTDTTAQLAVAGSIGVNSYLSSSSGAGVTVRFDDLVVVDPE
jgi:PKD repeat protein